MRRQLAHDVSGRRRPLFFLLLFVSRQNDRMARGKVLLKQRKELCAKKRNRLGYGINGVLDTARSWKKSYRARLWHWGLRSARTLVGFSLGSHTGSEAQRVRRVYLEIPHTCATTCPQQCSFNAEKASLERSGF